MELINQNETEKLIGAIIKVYNALGYGYNEKEYQTAYAEELKIIENCEFAREVYACLKYNGKTIRRYFLDFLVQINGVKIVVELKVANEVYKQHFNQVLQYLTNNNIRLGLIFVITPRKVVIKRVIQDVSVPSV